jgi:C-terminal processing protease CtpA/Prc
VYATRLYEQQGIRTGYLAYFLCAESEDAVLLDAMQKFINAGITELVLDLRYNPGGSVASSAKLAAMLVPDLNPDKTFVIFKGNAYGGTVAQSFRKSISFSGNNIGKDMNQLKTLHPSLKRIFVLTSPATISAAELLCNNLPTFMPVIRIGATTYGKDEASFRIEDTRNPRQVQWVVIPIVYKIFDANGVGGYNNGLKPQYEINDFSSLPLQDFGIPGDPSVDKALQIIYGNNQVNITSLRKRSFCFPAIKQYNMPGANTAKPIELIRP